MSEEVAISPEIPDCGDPAPSDRMTRLPPPKRPPARVCDDDRDIDTRDGSDRVCDLLCSAHRITGQEYQHPVLDVALVDTRSHPDVSAGHFREDERVLKQDIGRFVQDRLDETRIFPRHAGYPAGTVAGGDICEPSCVPTGFRVDGRCHTDNIATLQSDGRTDQCRQIVTLVYDGKAGDTDDLYRFL